jgi:magnesium transporter
MHTHAYASPQVLRVDVSGQVRRVHVRRRDLLREHGLQPRDLRRVDPSVDVSKTSPSIAVKENVLLVNLGGVR